MQGEQNVDPRAYLEMHRKGVFSYPQRRSQELRLKLSDVSLSFRPFFSRVCPQDSFYVSLLRAHSFSSVHGFGVLDRLQFIYAYHRGRSFGFELCREGAVRRLEDLYNVFLRYKIGLVDLVKESSDEIIIDVYECVSCSGLPVLGIPVCHFERGLISAVVEHLVGANRVTEEECWALGNAKCRFVVKLQ